MKKYFLLYATMFLIFLNPTLLLGQGSPASEWGALLIRDNTGTYETVMAHQAEDLGAFLSRMKSTDEIILKSPGMFKEFGFVELLPGHEDHPYHAVVLIEKKTLNRFELRLPKTQATEGDTSDRNSHRLREEAKKRFRFHQQDHITLEKYGVPVLKSTNSLEEKFLLVEYLPRKAYTLKGVIDFHSSAFLPTDFATGETIHPTFAQFLDDMSQMKAIGGLSLENIHFNSSRGWIITGHGYGSIPLSLLTPRHSWDHPLHEVLLSEAEKVGRFKKREGNDQLDNIHKALKMTDQYFANKSLFSLVSRVCFGVFL